MFFNAPTFCKAQTMIHLQNAKIELLEAVAKLELAMRLLEPPPSPQQCFDGRSPTFDVPFRSLARSRSPSPNGPVALVGSPQYNVEQVVSPGIRTPLVHRVRRRRGFYEAYPSPLARLPPVVVNVPVVRTGNPNPKYERVGDYLVLRQ